MIYRKRPEEIDLMRQAGRIVAETLVLCRDSVKAGMTTAELDQIAEDHIRSRGAAPSFKGYRGFTGTLCTSLNGEIVHGIPDEKVTILEGDVLKIDCGAIVEGFHGDSAMTVFIGEPSEQARRLSEVTRASLEAGIEQARIGNRVGDIGEAVQSIVEAAGFSVVREYVGHGIGRSLHEDPPIPNHGRSGKGIPLKEGMVIAIEPMVNIGSAETRLLEDGWTVVTADGSLSSHWEHTIAILPEGPEVLTRRPDEG
ncbi:MAG: type I methionyl aminopeptidase [Actinomycetota bacterium]